MIAVAILAALLYTLPNFYGESPAVQVSSARSTIRVDPAVVARVQEALKSASIAYSGAAPEGQQIRIRFRDAAMRDQARGALLSSLGEVTLADREDGQDLLLVGTLKPEALKRNQDFALKQNITTLSNRINELGVAEPIIQQQGADRIVVQLPGVQDVRRAKRPIGRTAGLELRMLAAQRMTPDSLAA